MPIIVSHTKVGKAYPHIAVIFDDVEDFIACVYGTQDRREQINNPVKNVSGAIKYMFDAFNNITKIITKDTYVIGECKLIDSKADKLGWNGGVK